MEQRFSATCGFLPIIVYRDLTPRQEAKQQFTSILAEFGLQPALAASEFCTLNEGEFCKAADR
jgi:hypothetical protein